MTGKARMRKASLAIRKRLNGAMLQGSISVYLKMLPRNEVSIFQATSYMVQVFL